VSAFNVQSIENTSSRINWIEPFEFKQEESNVFPDKQATERMTSLFYSTAYKSNGLEPGGVILGADGDWLEVDPRFPQLSKGRLTLESGVQFDGFLWDGHPHGMSKVTYPDESWIEGFFDHEKGFLPNCPIKMGYPDGELFDGIVSSVTDQVNGVGTLVYPNEDWISGTFSGNISVGLAKGVVTLENKARFQGSLFNGKPHGDGMITYQNNSQITGQFDDEAGLILTAPVRIKHFNGDVFEGFITSIDNREGQGKVTFANGDWIKGFFDGEAHLGEGTGELTLANGVKFQGDLQDGRSHGYGKVIFDNRVSNRRGICSIEGEFDSETGLILTEPVQMIYSNGTRFRGVVSADGMQGQGAMYFPNGDWIEGEFNGRKPVGLGKGSVSDKCGLKFEGTLLDGWPFKEAEAMALNEGTSGNMDFLVNSEEEPNDHFFENLFANENWNPDAAGNLSVFDDLSPIPSFFD
jgi:hypothetical protein